MLAAPTMPTIYRRCRWCGKASGCQCHDFAVAFRWRDELDAQAIEELTTPVERADQEADARAHPEYPSEYPRGG